MSNIHTILKDLSKTYDVNTGATDAAIAMAEQHLGLKQPPDYVQFLAHTNGFEGAYEEQYRRFGLPGNW